jgi:hypothetical protein
VATPDTVLPVSKARFDSRPDQFYAAFAASCQGPADEYRTLGRDSAQCRMKPTPEIAAGLIFRYDGALEIPRIVVEQKTEQKDGNVVVSISYFATVPQKSGGQQRVYLRSRQLDRDFDNLFRLFGGTPI